MRKLLSPVNLKAAADAAVHSVFAFGNGVILFMALDMSQLGLSLAIGYKKQRKR